MARNRFDDLDDAMPRVVLGSALSRWVHADGVSSAGEIALEVEGKDLRTVLSEVFAIYPPLRGYVLDEQGRVRHHLALFIDGASMQDKTSLNQPVLREIYIMQALSGG